MFGVAQSKKVRVALSICYLFGVVCVVSSPLASLSSAIASGVSAGRKAFSEAAIQQRRNLVYGEYGNLGYGFIKRILSSAPSTSFFPIVRYGDFQRNVALLFPVSPASQDKRMIIGIGFSPESLRSMSIPTAPLSVRTADSLSVSEWSLQTGFDYELLTGIRLSFTERQTSSIPVKIELLDSVSKKKVLATWSASARVRTQSDVRLTPAFEGFSFGRGGTSFVLRISVPYNGPIPAEVRAVVKSVDLRKYRILGWKENCFVAIDKRFEERLRSRKDAEAASWDSFIQVIGQHVNT